MSQSTSLPLEDVRKVFHLVAECRELGDDAQQWREHLLAGVVDLIGARVGIGGETPIVPWDEYPGLPQVEVGWSSQEEAHRCYAYWAKSNSALTLRAAHAVGPIATFTRDPFIDDDEWYALPEVQEIFRPSNIDGPMISRRLCDNLQGWCDGFVVLYAWGKRPSERDRDVVALLHDEIAPLVGGPLAARGEPSPSDLPPRKQQVLECLLMGATDKQIAASLELSRPTVSEYVSEILRHFDVASRTELMAAFLQRYRSPRSS